MTVTFLAVGTLFLSALVAWLESERRSHLTTISRLHNDLLDERAAAEFAHGIRDVAARNFASLWDEERETVEVAPYTPLWTEAGEPVATWRAKHTDLREVRL